jgi:hypothetical protein
MRLQTNDICERSHKTKLTATAPALLFVLGVGKIALPVVNHPLRIRVISPVFAHPARLGQFC